MNGDQEGALEYSGEEFVVREEEVCPWIDDYDDDGEEIMVIVVDQPPLSTSPVSGEIVFNK